MKVPKLRFSNIDKDYEIKNVSDITLNISSGKISKQLEYGEYNVYGSMGVIGKSNFYDYTGEKVLVARVGANAGSVNKINEKCCISDNTLVLEPKDVLNDYLYYALSHYNPKKLIFGSGQPLVTGGQLKKIKLGIPSKEEQTRVSKFLSLLDKKIELQSKKIEDLKLFKKGLINYEFNNLNDCKSMSLNDLGMTYSGLSGKTKEDFKNGNCKFINFMSVLKDNIDISSLTTVKIDLNEKQNKVVKGDLFFMTSSETKEEVGLCSTLSYEVKNLYLNSFCFGYRIDNLNLLNNEYLNCLLHTPKYRRQISNLGQGFTRVNISKNKLLELLIEVPDMKQQLRIVSINNNFNYKINLETKKLNKLNELKKGLIQSMFL